MRRFLLALLLSTKPLHPLDQFRQGIMAAGDVESSQRIDKDADGGSAPVNRHHDRQGVFAHCQAHLVATASSEPPKG